MQSILFHIYLAFNWLIALLPLRAMYVISDALFPLLYYVFRYRKKVVFQNLQNAFPEKSPDEIKAIAKKFFHFLVDIYLENIRLQNMSNEKLKKHCTVEGAELINQLYNEQKNIVLVVAHYGNWEWVSSVSFHFKHTALGVYKPLSNKHFDKWMNKHRSRFGVTVPMSHILRTMNEYKQQNKLYAVGLVADQSPMRSEIQYWTQFLNQDTPMYLGPEKIAIKMDNPVFFLRTHRVKRGYYHIQIVPVELHPKQAAPFSITEKHVRLLEDVIKESPEYWLWSHRRWKHKKEA